MVSFTVNNSETLHPVFSVYVIELVVPAITPVTKPVLLMLAKAGDPDNHGLFEGVPEPVNCVVAPGQTFRVPPIIGVGFTFTVKGVPDPLQPFAFFTVMIPVYVPAAVFAGTEIVIGLAGNGSFVTSTKLEGDAFHVML